MFLQSAQGFLSRYKMVLRVVRVPWKVLSAGFPVRRVILSWVGTLCTALTKESGMQAFPGASEVTSNCIVECVQFNSLETPRVAGGRVPDLQSSTTFH